MIQGDFYNTWQPFPETVVRALARMTSRHDIKAPYERLKKLVFGRETLFETGSDDKRDWNSPAVRAWSDRFFEDAFDRRTHYGLVPYMEVGDGTPERARLVVPDMVTGQFLWKLDRQTQQFMFGWAFKKGNALFSGPPRPDPRVAVYVDTKWRPDPMLPQPFTTPVGSLLQLADLVDSLISDTQQSNFMNAHPPFVVARPGEGMTDRFRGDGAPDAAANALMDLGAQEVRAGRDPMMAETLLRARRSHVANEEARADNVARSSVTGTRQITYDAYGARVERDRFMAWFHNEVQLAPGSTLASAAPPRAPDRLLETAEWIESRVYTVLGMTPPMRGTTRDTPTHKHSVSFSGRNDGEMDAEVETTTTARAFLQSFFNEAYRTVVVPAEMRALETRTDALLATLSTVSAAAYLQYLEATDQKDSEPWFRMMKDIDRVEAENAIALDIAEAARRIWGQAAAAGTNLDQDTIREHLERSPEVVARLDELYASAHVVGLDADGVSRVPSAPQFLWQPIRSISSGLLIELATRGMIDPKPAVRALLRHEGMTDTEIEEYMPAQMGVPMIKPMEKPKDPNAGPPAKRAKKKK